MGKKKPKSIEFETGNLEKRPHNAKTTHQMLTDDYRNRVYLQWEAQGCTDVTGAVLKFSPELTRDQARLRGWRIINNPAVRKRIGDKVSKRYNSAVMDFQERQLYLTDMIMGVIEPDADVKDKLNALKILNDMDGVGKPNALVQVNQNINLEEEREIVRNSVNEMLGKIEENRSK